MGLASLSCIRLGVSWHRKMTVINVEVFFVRNSWFVNCERIRIILRGLCSRSFSGRQGLFIPDYLGKVPKASVLMLHVLLKLHSHVQTGLVSDWNWEVVFTQN